MMIVHINRAKREFETRRDLSVKTFHVSECLFDGLVNSFFIPLHILEGFKENAINTTRVLWKRTHSKHHRIAYNVTI